MKTCFVFTYQKKFKFYVFKLPPKIVFSFPPSPTPRFFCRPYLAPYTVQYSVSRSSVMYLCLPLNLYFALYLCLHFLSHCRNINQYLFIDIWLCLCVLCVSLFAFLWWICIWFSSDVFPYDPHLRGSNIEYLAFLAFYQYHNGITSNVAYAKCCNDPLKGKIIFMTKKERRIQLILKSTFDA